MTELSGKVSVVTGGGSGIGRGTAIALAAAGAHVVIADIEREAAEAVAGPLRAQGVRALAVTTDVSDADSVEALAAVAYDEFGEVNVLINNAGVVVIRPITETSVQDWRWMLAVNLFGVIHGVNAFLPRMRMQQGTAHIVNTASIAGLAGSRGQGAYSATKSAVVGYSEMLARELEPEGIRVSVVCPGGVNTRIADAGRNRHGRFGAHASASLDLTSFMDPLAAGTIVAEGIRAERSYIFTHGHTQARVEERFRAILADYEPLRRDSS